MLMIRNTLYEYLIVKYTSASLNVLTIITGISFEGTLEALLTELLLEISGPVEPETFKLDLSFNLPI